MLNRGIDRSIELLVKSTFSTSTRQALRGAEPRGFGALGKKALAAALVPLWVASWTGPALGDQTGTIAISVSDIGQRQHVFELDENEAKHLADAGSDLTSDPGPDPAQTQDDQDRLTTSPDITAIDERGIAAEPDGSSDQFMPLEDPGSVSDGLLSAPAWVVAGRNFTVSWEGRLSRHDRVTIVEPGTPDDELGPSRQSLRVGMSDSGRLRAPDPLGTAEVRYFSNDQNAIVARVTVQVADPQIELDVPEQVIAGRNFRVAWSDNLTRHDRVTIVEPSTPDEELGSGRQNIRIGAGDSGTLLAPNSLGTFEVRYWRNAQERVVGRATVEVIDPEIELEVPEQIISGRNFRVAWSDNLTRHDRVTIVEPSTPDEELGSGRQNIRIGAGDSGTLLAPNSLGTFEVRYWRNAQERVVGRTTVAVVDPTIFLMAPAQVEAGSDFRVAWSENLTRHDRVTIVPATNDDDQLGSGRQNTRIGSNDSGTLRAPSSTGGYEVRYWRNAQHRVVGRTTVEVVPEGTGTTVEVSEVAPSLQELSELRQRVEELAARLEDASSGEIGSMRNELVGLGPMAVDLLVELVDDGRVAPWQAAGLTGSAIAPPSVIIVEQSPLPDHGRTPAETASAPGDTIQPIEQQAQATVDHRVVGIAANEALYLRAAADPGAAIVGMLPPDATGVQLAGDVHQDAEGGAWREVIDPSLPGGSGWADTSYFEAESAVQPIAQSQPTAGMHRVVGVEADDVLNVRQTAGADGTIVGMLPPNATGVELTGSEEQVEDGTWVEIADPVLPGGTGWVNASFLAPEAAGQSPMEDTLPSVVSLAEDFVQAEGYLPANAEALQSALQEILMGDPQSAFAPGGDLTPLAKAVLLVEAVEGVLPHARFRLSYGLAMTDGSPGAAPVPMSLIQVERYNLGPDIHAQLEREHGAANVAPLEAFGEGPHVSYRFAMRPIMGRTADLVVASRAEPAEPDAPCLGFHCQIAHGIGEHVVGWGDMESLDPPAFQPSYEMTRDGALSPAAALDKVALQMGRAQIRDGRLGWNGFEPRETVAPTEPFAEAVVEVNLGQDNGIDVIFHDDHLMDHEVSAMWQRIVSVSGGGADPLIYGARAVEHWTDRE